MRIFFIPVVIIYFLWLVVIPPFMAPDEPSHYTYTEILAVTKKLPSTLPFFKSKELLQTLSYLGFNLNRLETPQKFSLTPHLKKNLESINDNHTFSKEKHTIGIKYYPPLYYLLGVPTFWLTEKLFIFQKIYFLRLTSFFLSIIILFIFWKFTQRFKIKSLPKPLFFLSLALQPMFVFSNITYNNDLLQNLFGALFFLSLIFFWKNSDDKKFIIIFPLIFLFSLIAKPLSFLLLIPYFAAVILSKAKRPTKLILLAVSFFTCLAIYFFWYRHISITSASLAPFLSKPLPITFLSYLLETLFKNHTRIIFRSFWGLFGWIDTPYPQIIFIILLIFCFIAVIGIIKVLIKKETENKFILVSLVSLATYALFYLCFNFYSLKYTGNYIIVGRYFFIIFLPLMSLLLWGLSNIESKLPLIFSVLIIFLNFYALIFLIPYRYYHLDFFSYLLSDIRLFPFIKF